MCKSTCDFIVWGCSIFLVVLIYHLISYFVKGMRKIVCYQVSVTWITMQYIEISEKCLTGSMTYCFRTQCKVYVNNSH